ncbi:MAG: YdcF family protein [Patescibacteria group bacterium]|nr:YdcF family protein [Patescibacteria group bacterium]
MADQTLWAEFLTRVLCDRLPRPAAVPVYLFEQTADNQSSVLDAAVTLWREGRVQFLALSGYGNRLGYPGGAVWKKYLLSHGVPELKIRLVHDDPSGSTQFNTFLEAQSLVRTAKQSGWTSLAICASPFHQPRAFLSTVSAALHDYPELRVYNTVGNVLLWDEKVTHSQGVLKATRAGLIGTEWERIIRYQKKGDLVPLDLAVAYLRKRD